MLTREASEEFALKLLYTSIVKIVLMLFVMDANEDTIAATKAAKVKPRRPLGSKVIIVGYA